MAGDLFLREWMAKLLNDRHHVFYKVRLGTGDYEGEEKREQVKPEYFVEDANLVSSEVMSLINNKPSGYHTVVLDVDHHVAVQRSSTPGHYHLYIDVPMTQEKYFKLLDVMAEVGIVEPGYVEVSKKRGGTHVRLPWIKKEVPA